MRINNTDINYNLVKPAFKIYTIEEPGMRGLYLCRNIFWVYDYFVSNNASCTEGNVTHTKIADLGFLYTSATNQRNAANEVRRCYRTYSGSAIDHLSSVTQDCTDRGYILEGVHGFAPD